MWAQLLEVETHGLADAAADAVTDHGFAQGPGGGEADVRSVGLWLADAERREKGARVTGTPIINSSEVFRSQQADTFRKSRDGALPFGADREFLAASRAAAGKNGPAILGFHAGPEPVRLGAVAVIRLKSTFRHFSSMIQYRTAGRGAANRIRPRAGAGERQTGFARGQGRGGGKPDLPPGRGGGAANRVRPSTSRIMMAMKAVELYEKDFYRWAIHNADLLSAGEVAKADIQHIAEEIRDMGSRERRELLSRLRVLLAHLLKGQAQPEHRSRSWRGTILNQRHEIAALLDEMPSLHRWLDEGVPTAYRRAVEIAAAETGFPRTGFPKECPFSLKKALDTRFWPK